MPIDRQPAPHTLPHLEEPAPREWMRAPDPSVPRAAPQAAASPSWICLFRNTIPGIPGTKKPDERTAAARRPRNHSIAKSASPRIMRRQARVNPQTPPKPCPIRPNRPVNPEAAIAAADHAADKNADKITTNPATKTANRARSASIVAHPTTIVGKAAKATNLAAARCQNPPS